MPDKAIQVFCVFLCHFWYYVSFKKFVNFICCQIYWHYIDITSITTITMIFDFIYPFSVCRIYSDAFSFILDTDNLCLFLDHSS